MSSPVLSAPSTFPAGRIERRLGRPATTWSAGDLADLVEEDGIRLIALLHVGGDGELKALDFAPEDRGHARAILEGGERADGSSLFPGIPPGRSDVVLVPRPGTAFLDPFAPHPTLAVLCAHEDGRGARLPQSPAVIVAAAAERLAREAGLELHALGELEYFLGGRAGDEESPREGDRGYHATAPFVRGEALRRRALVTLADMGIGAKYAHSEVGHIPADEGTGILWEQHEIELALAPLPRASDAVVLARWVLRNLAHREGMRVSFEPMVSAGHPGTGLHFHFSPRRDGARVPLRGADGALTDASRWLIGGFVQLSGAMMAFGNRTDASFLRLGQAKEAPNRLSWGERDRTALVRIPLVPAAPNGEPTAAPTIEMRLPDGSAHPHLLLAAAAQAVAFARGMPDLDALLERTASSSGGSVPIPRDAAEVRTALAAARGALESGGVFPASMLDALLATPPR